MGLVTLLLSDIVGSTPLWAEHEEAMAVDLPLHDQLVGRIVSDHRGTVVKYTGDGAMAAFDDPSDAVMAAVDLHRRIATTPWRVPSGITVRIAIHCGTVIARDGDLFGTPVNRTARLLGLCPPGAVVVSSTAAGLLADRCPPGVRLRDAGRVYLRGFTEPEDTFCVVAEGVAEAGRLQGTGDTPLHPFPAAGDSFVGRADELSLVSELLAGHHLVSLVGVAGMGKTRLALEAAATLSARFPAGVYWCDLTPATSDEAVVPALVDAVGARTEPDCSPLESIVTRLRAGRCLVVLDNCEHVLTAARDVVTSIRSAAPDARLLVTSREALGVRGEHLVPLSSLPTADSVELFVGRAREAGVDVTDRDAPVVGRICQRLDGIPLAVELAAARCRTLAPAEIDQRLDHRFRFLRSGRPGVERHRTLQAAVAWSYDLLGAEERDLFDRMAVFAGGSLLDGIAAVAGVDEYDALDLIDGLVAKSMLTATDTELGTRYRQLETLRQYAEDRLVERGLLQETRDRHVAWAIPLAASIGSRRGGPEGGRAFRRFVHELDNFRVAVDHAVASGQRQHAYDVLGPVAVCAWHRLAFEILDWIDVSDDAGPWTAARARLVGLQAILDFQRGDSGAPRRAVDRVPADLRLTELVVDASYLDQLWVRQDFDAAEELTEDYRRVDPTRARVLELFARTSRQYHDRLGSAEHAVTLADAGATVSWFREQGDEVYLASALSHYANAFLNAGQPEQAVGAALEALDTAEHFGAYLVADGARSTLARAIGQIAADEPDGPERRKAAALVRQALVDSRARGNRRAAVGGLSGVAHLVRDVDPATAYLLGVAVSQELGGARRRNERTGQLPPDEIAALDARAADMTADDAISLALATLDRHFLPADR